MPTPTPEFLAQLIEHRDSAKRRAEFILTAAKQGGREVLNDSEEMEFRELTDTMTGLSDRIREYRSELARCGDPHALFSKARRRAGSAAAVAPLGFGAEELRSAHARLGRGETVVLETRAGFTSADSLIPPQLFPIPTFPRHENRLLDRLPGFALDVPSLEYVQVSSVTGSAAIVGEGQPKPEVTMPSAPLICTAKKLAVHCGISWESWADYEAFTQAVQTELMKQIIDLENHELVYGDPVTGLNGMTTAAGILTLAATGGTAIPPNNWDDLAAAIAKLRTGSALASPDLLCVHPTRGRIFASRRTAWAGTSAAPTRPMRPSRRHGASTFCNRRHSPLATPCWSIPRLSGGSRCAKRWCSAWVTAAQTSPRTSCGSCAKKGSTSRLSGPPRSVT